MHIFEVKQTSRDEHVLDHSKDVTANLKDQGIQRWDPNGVTRSGRRPQTNLPFALQELPPSNSEHFRDRLQAARQSHGPFGQCLEVRSVHEYASMRLFLDEDGLSGFAIKDRNVLSVFSHAERPTRGVTRFLMSKSVHEGGIFLDAFDTALPQIYSACGFRVVSRLKWNEQAAPGEWSQEAFHKFNFGKPDVVFMAYLSGEYQPYLRGEGRYVDSYEEGLQSQERAYLDFLTGVSHQQHVRGYRGGRRQ